MIAFKRRRFFIFLLATGLAAGIPSAAKAQTCVSNVPHVTGQWMTLPYQMPINPIQASLLRTGEIVIAAGSENHDYYHSEGSQGYRAAVWDPTGTTQSSIAVQNLSYDVFCSGTAVLPDGRHLVVGGTADYTVPGDNRASFFDPATGRFVQSQSMVDGRWYATATALGDGRIMTFSGLDVGSPPGGTNNTVEIYSIGTAGAGWSSPSSAPFVPPLYPRMALLPNGKVFYTGHGTDGPSNTNGWMFDPSAQTWTSSAPTTRSRSYGSAVILPLLPPAYTPKVMAFGGNNPATNTTEIIDLSAASPAWTPGPSMSTGRIQMNAVILPDGTVLAMGGSLNHNVPNGPGKTADLYDPVTNAFRSAGTASYSRLYHSTALLLPDARVMSIGSNPGSHGRYEPAIEIYTPAYLFDSSDLLITTGRPSITAITPSGVIGYDAPFSVDFSSVSPIASAVLMRPGSATHAFDMEQRLIGLCGPPPQPPCSAAGGTLSLTSPPNGNIAPPGYYMLFLLDSAGVPSKAQFLQLSAHSTSPPSGAIASPVPDVTIPAGGSVDFSTNTTAAKYSWIFPGGSPETSEAQAPGSVVFDVPGTYVTSLTVIDADGNSDPSPPTRTITVTPLTPDFSITSSPPAQVVTPGQATTFTVTVTPITGFTGPVTLTVDSFSPFPSGVTSGGFSPASIDGSGSSTLTMNTTTSTVPFAVSLAITGTSGELEHTAAATLLIHLAPPAGLTATPGSAQVSLSWAASIGANGYHVKRSRTSGGPYVGIACPTGTSYVDTGLTNGTTYYYVVSASYAGGPNAGGASADSSEASATPEPSPPAAPTGLTATHGNAQVALAWSASSGATSYHVKSATVSGGPYTTIASPTATSYTDTGLTNGTTYYYVVTAVSGDGESANSSQASATPQPPSLPPPWVNQDVGAVAAAGSAGYSGGVFTVMGSGKDIFGTADEFHYVYQPLSGNATITARVASVQNTNQWAKAGVMIRETLAANSRHAMMVVQRSEGLAFQRRLTAGASTVHTQGPLVTAPYWVRMVRSGSTFSAYYSPDGTTWTLLGSATITMATNVYVGLALTSHLDGVLNTSTLDSVAVTANASPSVAITSPVNGASFTAPVSITINADASDTDGTIAKVDFYQGGNFLGTDTTFPYSFTWSSVPAGSYSLTAVATDNSNGTGTSTAVNVTVQPPSGSSLPPPWVNQDVGAVAAAGSAGYSGAVFTVIGSGSDIYGTADEFHYVYQPLSGDASITARVASVQNTNQWAKAGVMIRETLAANSKHAMMVVQRSNGLAFQRRLTVGGSTVHTQGPVVAAPYWVRMVRSGSTFTAYHSPNGTTWTLLGSATITMATNVYVGLALTSHADGVLNTSTFDSVAVTGPGPANSPPSVSITSPSNGATFSAPASITINADASDTDGTIAKVDFYQGGNFLGTDTSSPYSFTWSSVPAGSYSLTAVATDNANGTGTSTAVNVTVQPAGSSLPPPWVNQDVGAVAAAGSAGYSGAVFTVVGSGSDIYGTADEFHYVYQPLSGNATITARVASVQNTNQWAKAGVMIRETLAANSKHAMMVVQRSNGLAFQRRLTVGGSTVHTQGPIVAAPYWVRMVRSGSTFTAYHSPNGTTWTLLGSATITMATNVYVGLALTSHADGVLNTSTFDSVAVTGPGPANSPPSVSITSPSNGATFSAPASITINADASDTDGTIAKVDFYQGGNFLGTDTTFPYSFTWSSVPAGSYSLTAVATDNANGTGTSTAVNVTVQPAGSSLPPPWVNQDVGAVAAAGSAGYSGAVFTVVGSGSDIYGTADEFHYVYQPLSGNATITARVASVQNTNQWAKAGVMIRETLAANSKHAMMVVQRSNGLAFQRRLTAGASTVHTQGPLVAAPYWVRMVRSGSTFTAYHSPDGTTWTLLGSATITMATNVYVGLALTSHADGVLNTSTFDGVAVTAP